jgi:hypothetical protein
MNHPEPNTPIIIRKDGRKLRLSAITIDKIVIRYIDTNEFKTVPYTKENLKRLI